MIAALLANKRDARNARFRPSGKVAREAKKTHRHPAKRCHNLVRI
ncbi:unnamed protein product [Ciceribacter selenitireducens ATCC BAA-1503]|jgi:hypothetical protein|uniref:Uncharacterized protein n=1 Tax=Ciceribacter selenitireducens ATCC BAA-1503 TaxID=1336235 RepID=A0A376AIP6_9HYPH|nr:unnamed protein product [Ciceribacter selenitireducens ATCC BAA-1503]